MRRWMWTGIVLLLLTTGCGRTVPHEEPKPADTEDKAGEQEVDETLESILNQLDELDQILEDGSGQEEIGNETDE